MQRGRFTVTALRRHVARWDVLGHDSHEMEQDIVAALTKALEPHVEVLEAYLFGSQARGDAHASSDVDVAVYLDKNAKLASAFGHAADIGADLMAALGRNDVDVVVLNDAPPLLYHRVLRDGIRLLSRDLAKTTTHEGQAMSRYIDFKPKLEMMAALQKQRLDEGRFGA